MGLTGRRTYVGSHAVQIREVIAECVAADLPATLDTALPAATALGAEAYTSEQVAPIPAVLDTDSDTRDGDAVKQLRQSRLRRWQRQP